MSTPYTQTVCTCNRCNCTPCKCYDPCKPPRDHNYHGPAWLGAGALTAIALEGAAGLFKYMGERRANGNGNGYFGFGHGGCHCGCGHPGGHAHGGFNGGDCGFNHTQKLEIENAFLKNNQVINDRLNANATSDLLFRQGFDNYRVWANDHYCHTRPVCACEPYTKVETPKYVPVCPQPYAPIPGPHIIASYPHGCGDDDKRGKRDDDDDGKLIKKLVALGVLTPAALAAGGTPITPPK